MPVADEEVCDPPVPVEPEAVTGDLEVLPASDSVELLDGLPLALDELTGENV